MRFGFFLCAAAVAGVLSSSAAFAASPAKKAPVAALSPARYAPIKVAPMDEYFGKMKLSPLGINNTIHDTSLHLRYDPANAARYYQALEWAEDALNDWARKYPQDTWLPGRAYFMSHIFWQMHSPDADAAAQRCRTLLFRQFPTSHWAVLAKQESKDAIAPAVASAAAQNQPAAAFAPVAKKAQQP